MTKTTNITVQSLVININVTQAAAKEAGFPDLVGMLIQRAVAQHEGEGAEADGTTGSAGGNGWEFGVPNTGVAASTDPHKDIADFLTSNPKFKARTGRSLITHFGYENETICHALNEMIGDGRVTMKQRRRDGEALLSLVPVAVAPQDVGAAAAALVTALVAVTETPVAEPVVVSSAPVEAEVLPVGGETEAPADEPVVGAEAKDLTFDNVLSFLTSNPKFTKRSLDSIVKYFSEHDEDDVASVLGEMDDEGLVITNVRRKDSTTMYRAAVVAVGGQPTGAVVTPDAILTFLHSNPKFTLRTKESIVKQFPGSSATAIDQALLELLTTSKVSKKSKRRGVGVLFRALVPAPVAPVAADAAVEAPAEPAAPAMNVTNLLAFLRSDPRYTKRTTASVAKHFGTTHDSASFIQLLDDAEDDVTTSVRRRDGVSLLAAA